MGPVYDVPPPTLASASFVRNLFRLVGLMPLPGQPHATWSRSAICTQSRVVTVNSKLPCPHSVHHLEVSWNARTARPTSDSLSTNSILYGSCDAHSDSPPVPGGQKAGPSSHSSSTVR